MEFVDICCLQFPGLCILKCSFGAFARVRRKGFSNNNFTMYLSEKAGNVCTFTSSPLCFYLVSLACADVTIPSFCKDEWAASKPPI